MCLVSGKVSARSGGGSPQRFCSPDRRLAARAALPQLGEQVVLKAAIPLAEIHDPERFTEIAERLAAGIHRLD